MGELITLAPWVFYVGATLFGLLVGSFLNVVIYRLPIMMQRQWDAELLAWQSHKAEIANGEAAQRAANDSIYADPDETMTTRVLDDATLQNAAHLQAVAESDEAIKAAPAEASPETFNLATPRSACPNCQRPITALENIPILSWLALRGRCRGCANPISARYPLVEALTGVLTLAVALRFGIGVEAIAAIVLTWYLIALSGIDIDHQLLPDTMTLPLLWMGLLISLFDVSGATRLFIAPGDAIVGALAGYLVLWSVYQLFRLLTGKEGMGYGDFKLLAALGAWLGWQYLPLIIILSALVGSVYGITMIVLRQRSRGVPMPFGPWLAMAGWLVLMYGERINTWYFELLGL